MTTMTQQENGFKRAREELARQLRYRIEDDRVIEAFASVPREEFIPDYLADAAYQDSALPIAGGQTISQPTMIAIMLEVARLRPTDKVLDVGTGSGYQAALLSHLVNRVVGVERIPSLVEHSREVLQRLHCDNVEVHQAHEHVLGWPEEAPYDVIIVAASSPSVPPSLVDQLSTNGRLIIPVGEHMSQELVRVTNIRGGLRTEALGGCVFVPLIGEEAWRD